MAIFRSLLLESNFHQMMRGEYKIIDSANLIFFIVSTLAFIELGLAAITFFMTKEFADNAADAEATMVGSEMTPSKKVILQFSDEHNKVYTVSTDNHGIIMMLAKNYAKNHDANAIQIKWQDWDDAVSKLMGNTIRIEYRKDSPVSIRAKNDAAFILPIAFAGAAFATMVILGVLVHQGFAKLPM